MVSGEGRATPSKETMGEEEATWHFVSFFSPKAMGNHGFVESSEGKKSIRESIRVIPPTPESKQSHMSRRESPFNRFGNNARKSHPRSPSLNYVMTAHVHVFSILIPQSRSQQFTELPRRRLGVVGSGQRYEDGFFICASSSFNPSPEKVEKCHSPRSHLLNMGEGGSERELLRRGEQAPICINNKKPSTFIRETHVSSCSIVRIRGMSKQEELKGGGGRQKCPPSPACRKKGNSKGSLSRWRHRSARRTISSSSFPSPLFMRAKIYCSMGKKGSPLTSPFFRAVAS